MYKMDLKSCTNVTRGENLTHIYELYSLKFFIKPKKRGG